MPERASGAADDSLVLVAESAGTFAARTRGADRVRALRGVAGGFDASVWREMAALGWTGMLLPESQGGSGLGIAHAAEIARALGRHLAPEPFSACAVLAASVLSEAGDSPLARRLRAGLVAGDAPPAVAFQEDLLTYARTEATVDERGRLTGTKRFVRPGAGAAGFIVAAGGVLHWVEAGAPGLGVATGLAADGATVATLELEGALGVPLVAAPLGEAALARAIDRALVAASAELCGLASQALEMTLDYLRTRVQFARPIGSFQALQHRAVDLYLQLELATAALEEVIGRFDDRAEAEPQARAALASRAKARCSDAALAITREAIQLHGAIGFTDEHDIGLYLKRALALAAWLGNAAEHRRRYVAAVAFGAAVSGTT